MGCRGTAQGKDGDVSTCAESKREKSDRGSLESAGLGAKSGKDSWPLSLDVA